LYEPPRGAQLDVEVMVVGLGTELDLLHLDHGLAALGLARLLLLLVLVLAEVEDLAHRRHALRVDLNQIEPSFPCSPESILSCHHTQHGPIGSNDAHLRHPDPMVDPDLWSAGFAPLKASPHCHRLVLLSL